MVISEFFKTSDDYGGKKERVVLCKPYSPAVKSEHAPDNDIFIYWVAQSIFSHGASVFEPPSFEAVIKIGLLNRTALNLDNFEKKMYDHFFGESSGDNLVNTQIARKRLSEIGHNRIVVLPDKSKPPKNNLRFYFSTSSLKVHSDEEGKGYGKALLLERCRLGSFFKDYLPFSYGHIAAIEHIVTAASKKNGIPTCWTETVLQKNAPEFRLQDDGFALPTYVYVEQIN